MDKIVFDVLTSLPGTLFLLLMWLAISGGFLLLSYFVLTLPMRRAERARLFLDLMEAAIQQGRPVEETMISMTQSGDMSMGVRFHLVTAWLEQNLRIGDALAKVPQFLPPQITAMLITGQKIGDLRKVLPACRQLLKDAVSKTRAGVNYLVVMTLVITPLGIWVLSVINVIVLPQFRSIFQGTLGEGASSAGVQFLFDHSGLLIAIQIFLIVLLWIGAFLYMAGPRVVVWFPICNRLPWRRKRLQRDFSTMLALLLDSGVPEPVAVTMAADCTSSNFLRRRAVVAAEGLKRGLKLSNAVQFLDDSGELRWRLANGFHGGGGFLRSLAGWHESLDAKAFQEEQAAAHGITSAMVLWSGVFVGAIVISVFALLVSLINAAVLW